MKKILVIVDMQNDFITGSLSNRDALAIVPNVVQKVKNAMEDEDTVIYFTMDTHEPNYLDTEEGRNLPIIHCIPGTRGWEIIDELQPYLDNDKCRIFEKDTFGSYAMAEEIRLKAYNYGEPDEIEIIGICTDICVISNALILKANLPNVPIYLDPICCAGVTPESHQTAIEAMEACHIHIR